MQEYIMLVVFTILAYFMFGETLKWNNVVYYLFLVGAVVFAFWERAKIDKSVKLILWNTRKNF